MSVLDRVKDFLPRIEKANADLQKEINRHGTERFQIDKDLGTHIKKAPAIEELNVPPIEPSKEITGDAAPHNTDDEPDETTDDDKQEIELNFALGDFSETSIAKAEEELQKEAENDQSSAEGNHIDED